MSEDLNKPQATDGAIQILTDIRDNLAALTKMDMAAMANLPVGAIQWSDANERLEKWSGSAWEGLLPDGSTLKKGLVQLSTNSNSLSIAHAATPSAVKTIRDMVANLVFSSVGGQATANQVPDIDSLNGSLSNAKQGIASLQSGHVRAGNMQLVTGADMAAPLFQVTGLPSNSTWESVGKTGSGKDNIWSALDNLPSNATVLIVSLRVAILSSSTSAPYVSVRAASDAVATPGLDAHTLYRLEFEPHQSSSQVHSQEVTCYIPLSNAAFKLSYYLEAATANYVTLYYRGFLTD